MIDEPANVMDSIFWKNNQKNKKDFAAKPAKSYIS
jgi:hypothetical protein